MLISVFFWIFSYNGEPLDGAVINTFIVNPVFVIIDLMVTAMPIRLFHAWQPMGLNIIYVAFSVIFWALGGKNHLGQTFIFKELDYDKKPGIAALNICVVILIVQPFIQFLLYLIYKGRLWLYRKIYKLPTEQSDPEELTGRQHREQNESHF